MLYGERELPFLSGRIPFLLGGHMGLARSHDQARPGKAYNPRFDIRFARAHVGLGFRESQEERKRKR